MNKIYRIIWSVAQQAFVVVSELTKAQGKSSAGGVVGSVAEVKKASQGKFALSLVAISTLLGLAGTVSADVNLRLVNGRYDSETGDTTYSYTSLLTLTPNSNLNLLAGSGIRIEKSDIYDNNRGEDIPYIALSVDNSVLTNQVSTALMRSILSAFNPAFQSPYAISDYVGKGASTEAVNSLTVSDYSRALMGTLSGYMHVNDHHIGGMLASRYSANNYGVMGNSNNTDSGHKFEVGAGAGLGVSAITLGKSASTVGDGSIAIGRDSTVDGKTRTFTQAIGVSGSQNFIGVDTSQSSSNSVAIGSSAYVKASKSIALGHKAKVDGPYGNFSSVAIGDEASVTAKNSVAIGYKANSNSDDYIGSLDTNQGSNLAIGDQSKATNNYAMALGTRAEARGYGSVAFSYNAKGYGKYGIAFGENAVAGQLNGGVLSGYGEIALGNQAKATGFRSFAMGIQTQAEGERSIVIGELANSTTGANQATAIGYKANVTKEGATALGRGSQGFGKNSTAVGSSAKALEENAVAVGINSQATKLNSVAIGNYA